MANFIIVHPLEKESPIILNTDMIKYIGMSNNNKCLLSLISDPYVLYVKETWQTIWEQLHG